jgi:hypothetical protein
MIVNYPKSKDKKVSYVLLDESKCSLVKEMHHKSSLALVRNYKYFYYSPTQNLYSFYWET